MISLFLTKTPGPTDDFWYSMPGRRTASGIDVSADAMTLSTVWACTRLFSASGGCLPFNLMQQLGMTKRIATEHRAHRLIHSLPNPELTSMRYRCFGISQQINGGNFWSEIERDALKRPVALWPIHCSRVELTRADARMSDALQVAPRSIVWKVKNNGADPSWIPDVDMLHVPSVMIADDGVQGKGVISHARETIGHGLATVRQGAAYMKNSARPGYAIVGGKFKVGEDRESFRKSWMDVHGGAENNGKPALLPEGSTLEQLGFNQQESQFLETLQFNVTDICRWYGAPPHMVQDLSRSTFSNIEHQGIDYVVYSLIPWLKLWEEEIWRKLLTEDEQSSYYAKHNVEGLLRGDSAARAAFYQAMWQLGAFSINEIREKEDMNPIGPDGDKHFVQTSYTTVENLANPPEAEEQGSEGDMLRQSMETYGIGVRAGTITPQTDDENQYRQALGLPPLTEDAKAAWKEDNGFRRPITIRMAGDTPATQFGQPEQPKEGPQDELSRLHKTISDLTAYMQSKPDHDGLAKRESVIREAAKMMVYDTVTRMVGRESTALTRAATKEPGEFFKWLDEFYDEHQVVLCDALRRPVQAYFTACGSFADLETTVSTTAMEFVRESREAVLNQTNIQPQEWPTLTQKFKAVTETWKTDKVDKCVESIARSAAV